MVRHGTLKRDAARKQKKLKNGAEYIDSLRKLKPVIYYKGKRIQDVTRHPATSPHVKAAAMTYATGNVFIRHFDSDGSLLTFDIDTAREYFREMFKKGEEIASNLKDEVFSSKSGEECEEGTPFAPPEETAKSKGPKKAAASASGKAKAPKKSAKAVSKTAKKTAKTETVKKRAEKPVKSASKSKKTQKK